MIITEGVVLPESNKADFQNSYISLGISQTDGNHASAAWRSVTCQIPTQGEAGHEDSAEWEKQDPGYQYPCPAIRVIRDPTGIMSWPLEEIIL